MNKPKHPVPKLEKRLQGRYRQMVNEHLNPNTDVAPGAKALPTQTAQAFAATQAAWRFYGNEETTLPALGAPLLQAARTALAGSASRYALVLHDLSHLNYHTHTRKQDRTTLSGPHELGYELQTALLVEAVAGSPIAPLYQSLTACAGQHTTATEAVQPAQAMTDAVTTALSEVERLKLGKRLVHIIDREADSVFHLRQWDDDHHLFVVRADNERLVQHAGVERSLPAVAQHLQAELKAVRAVRFKGRAATQFVAEAAICLTRPACLHRVVDGQRKRQSIKGRPLAVRLVVSEIRAAEGTVLAQWLLLTNVPPSVSAERIAQWYYWRWRIESYFKLLKSAGHEIEHWQQTTAVAVAKRLLIAGMACVVVWHLARDPSSQAAAFRAALVRLSGRQMKYGCDFTAAALLAGLGHLLPMLVLLEDYDLQALKDLAADCLPGIYPLRR
jgi:hypothetical protein